MGIEDQAFGFRPAQMLVQLQAAHDEVLAAMEMMERVTNRNATQLQYLRARFAISSASMRRRELFHRFCRQLRTRLQGTDLECLREAQQVDRALTSQSIAHVSRWTSQAVGADWGGYCEASGRIRAEMKHELDTEERLLMPILERLARRDAPGTLAEPRAA